MATADAKMANPLAAMLIHFSAWVSQEAPALATPVTAHLILVPAWSNISRIAHGGGHGTVTTSGWTTCGSTICGSTMGGSWMNWLFSSNMPPAMLFIMSLLD